MINPFQQTIIGIIGGGQLGKMMAQSAKKQGYRVIVLDPQIDCPASQVCDQHIVAQYNDKIALKQLSDLCTVVTYEFENVDCQTIKEAIDEQKFPQGTKVLEISQNRLFEKEFLTRCHINIAPYQAVLSPQDLDKAIEKVGYPCVLKTTRFGYDGKGQIVLKGIEQLHSARELAQQSECVLEGWVNFEKEISLMISRNINGECSVFPVSENHHRHNILHTSCVPARLNEGVAARAKQYAEVIANELQLVGTLGIEFFVGIDDKLYVNELAPRPHNSGHYSIEACNFSQFDVSIQAILNLPMPNITLHSPVVMINVLGQHIENVYRLKAQKANWHFHDYGKLESKENRKMGHITILTKHIDDTLLAINNTHIWD
ncbi:MULTISPECIES: 5-(carboxyamino)imidazole ribonucleotide synthase [unclassified Granulicatella]|uniref:5-(carboxyamino)imidazole ribonucleotide synthase n=1 Tax=unclassified Granulicatella TaxID=2630493 RepID=UPI0010745DFB|nr:MULTISPECIES: 5-(carboxyamino)imidazole ribonucleotide synthase [unclassified Granulicatella]MBF0779777.1 5-(carboxyamino)imidazole ribonucleotide synthase [Granulicatella sp. 19428wC4_WM01]TFU96179.1 5-(carboxyamino)imidazole ribonucleotide synthase [Granulicatella sp. WM01]